MDRSVAEFNEDNLEFVESLYFAYSEDPESVDPEWQAYFRQQEAESNGRGTAPGPSFEARSIFDPVVGSSSDAGASPDAIRIARGLDRLIAEYRAAAHLSAAINPIVEAPALPDSLRPESFGLRGADLDTPVDGIDIPGMSRATPRQVIDRLDTVYRGSLTAEFSHIRDRSIREWMVGELESTAGHPALSPEEAKYALKRLTHAELFEQFLHTKFVGAKRFSIEGAEALIPLLDFCLDEAAISGGEQLFIGMAHRGRLNVLTNTIRKSPREIFLEFEDSEPEKYMGSGDVKYHKGARREVETLSGKPIRVALNFNPSHLEFVYPVVTGRVYALQAQGHDTERRKCIPLVIHGDASVMGQGVVPETLNMQGLDGYRTGGVVHVVVNNQIGFTTPSDQSRTSSHCTGVAHMVEIPILHVNADDIPAVARAARLAMRFRQTFRRDVFIDLVGFRKYGHNEGDEPFFTQPQMYATIKQHPGIRALYAEQLVGSGQLGAGDPEEMLKEFRAELDEALAEVREGRYQAAGAAPRGNPIWVNYKGGDDRAVPEAETQVDKDTLLRLLDRLTTVPEEFQPHRGIARLLKQRKETAGETRPLDWGTGEALAFATLLDSGVNVRVDGQDAERGTFAHRHSVLHDQNTGETYVPLKNLREGQGDWEVINSPLSEAAVMGFDYGYSRECPDSLVCWEAQFGDFSNGAQVIIDQFVSAGEDKWGILSGLVLLLPHGFEGQGPEHSSARLERFLALCAQDNMTICNLTTPAQLFHLLRRQIVREIRKPLVVMTPKSLLRHKSCVSPLSSFYQGKFHKVIPDVRNNDGQPGDPSKVRRVLLCTGKVYYDLSAERDKRGIEDVAIVRMEQMYPLPDIELEEVLAPYSNASELVWVQEEPWNMGAWYYMRARIPALAYRHGFDLTCVSRPESASPATGSKAAHEIEQSMLVEQALVGESA